MKALRKAILFEAANIWSIATQLKSDDIVSDEACDEIVESARRLVLAFNAYSGEINPLPEKLGQSPYQEGSKIA